MPTADRYQQYEVLRREDGSLWELGRGAMGITYKAFDTNLRFAVALKVINSAYLESDTARQRFLREARAAAALRHPNVASVFNLGTDRDDYFYVMEFIDGETVHARVKRKGPLKPVEALNIALQVARALAVAAKQQLVHRDLKPTNLMLVDQEEGLTVKVIDFGLAKVAKEIGEDSMTLTVGGFVGTPHFASPEQVEEGDVDVRSDFYSLGATLYFVLTGQSPFSGSIGQIMSQHLYKPLPMEPLTSLPPCVASLVRQMMEKDRNARPQTAQELQKAILACLDEIRGSPGTSLQKTDESTSASETLDLTFASGQQLAPGVTLAQTYQLVEELIESPYARKFLAEDLRHHRRAQLLVFSPEFLADTSSLSALREAVGLLRRAPHKMLREVYSLETFSDCTFLVEEYVAGTSLLDLLRRRGALTAPEVARLLNLLAPLADHASRCGLQNVDLALSGIILLERVSTRSGISGSGISGGGILADRLRLPLTAWETLSVKVDAIDFSFSPDHGTWAGMATRVQGVTKEAPRGTYARQLSLLAYELLGGPRARLDSTGQFSPIATLTREGNAVLRRGIVDEFSSAGELSRLLAATIEATPTHSIPTESKEGVAPPSLHRPPSSTPLPSESKGRVPPPSLHRPPSSFPAPSESKERVTPEPLRETPPPKPPPGGPLKGRFKIPPWLWALVLGLIALLGIGVYLLNSPRQVQEIAALSVRTEPTGASFLLDGKPPQVPPNIFTHVPFGSHQLSATLDNYEPIKRDIQVRGGMSPEIRLQFKPVQETTTLSVRTYPSGASILLDGKSPQLPPGTFTHVPFGSHRLFATLDDYQSIEQDIQVRRGMSPEIRLELKPIQEVAALTVQTDLSGASILLDGKPPQVPPGTFTHVPFGSHRLSATLDNYQPFEQDIQVRRGMSPEIRLELKPIQEIAALSVQTDPAGASILLDGKPPQVPPGTFTHVPFGPHRLSATLDNYRPVEQDVQVRRGMSPEIRLELKPTQEIAALSVQTDPSGASILLDGKPAQGPPGTFTHVPFGSHRLSATLDNYQPFDQDIQVRRGMSPEIHLELKPTQEIAALSVQTDPSGASVLLDGKPPQLPPGTFTHVPFGSHQLSATLDNYQPIEQDVQVRRGMSPEIRLELKPIQEVAALTVQTDPSGASVLLDGKPPQTPPGTFTHVPFGSHRLSATLDNYQPIEQDVQVRRGMSPDVRVELKPIQEVAALTVQTDPSGASILLDGKPPQVAPGTFTHIPFGPHRLSATLDNYQSIEQDVQVRRGMSPEVRLELKPIQEVAALTVQTDPSGASILLDGKPPQVAPGTFTHVPFGPHRLSATLDNYQSIEQDVQVRRGMSPEVRLELKPIQEVAALTVQTDPSGASILLDGKPPQVAPGTFTHVPFGPHRLSATLDNYQSIEQDVQVRRGMSPEVRLELKPIQEVAALTVQTDPSGASILLDGKPPQVAPGTFTHVPFGSHRLSATLDNYQSIEQDVQVRRGMSPEVRLELKPIQEVAALIVQTAPSGASILLDGKPPQVAPGTFTHVPFGSHRLSAALDNYQPIEQDIQVRRAMSPEIRLELKPVQEVAALSVQTEPSGASILLDGKPPQVPPGTFTHVPIGPHKLSATLDGYEPVTQEMEIRVGIAPEIQLQLKPSHETFESLLRDAQLGDPTAMMKLGLLYLKKGTPNDDASGFDWLNQAFHAPNRNLEAGVYVADCYLSGKGTKQDFQKAEEITIPLANQKVVRAMTLAGRILQISADNKRREAAGTASPKIQKQLKTVADDLDRQAREWWERAEKDDWNASAHLANCYEEGWGGLEKSEDQAEKRYKAGVEHGNALSMFFYGLMIDKKPGRHAEAQNLISRAAAIGVPSAIKWCKDNHVTFGEKNTR